MQGSCLCGCVRLDIEGNLERAPEACHCTQCRKHSGHFLAAVNVRRSALTIHGADHATWYRSSEKAQRGFCSNCGSTLFWNPTLDGYEWIAVAMGTLDAPSGVRLAKHTFVGDKGDYYDIADGVPQSVAY
jgi:hypothetical protein